MLKDEKIPEFKTLQEERDYWDARGPLATGNKGRWNKPVPGQKHDSFLAVRMTGKEITQLRRLAENQGVGISTYVRMLLNKAVAEQKQPDTSLAEIKSLLENLLDRTPSPDKTREKKDRYKA